MLQREKKKENALGCRYTCMAQFDPPFIMQMVAFNLLLLLYLTNAFVQTYISLEEWTTRTNSFVVYIMFVGM